MSEQTQDHSTSVRDVKQLGLFAGLASLSYVFWVCGGMEMVERLAYNGVRTSSSLYITDAKSRGGLGLVESQLGVIFLVWALVQTFVPVFTGGISDRIGYKQTIFASTVFKIIGYLIMGFFPTYAGFLVGAIIMAFGTGIFKPGIQGTVVKSINRQNSSIAWGVFYQTVNIGGWLGPLVAVQLRQLSWDLVFFVCAAIISINFFLLMIYKEPGKEERLAHRAKVREGSVKENSLFRESIKEFTQPILLWYMALFSAFYFMLYAIWDVGPLYFRDWVDTSVMVRDLFGENGTDNRFWITVLGMSKDGTRLFPEGLISINTMLIMFVCFIVAGWSAKLKAANSMAIGAFLASSTMILFASSNFVWLIVVAIMIFSIGEMLSSPKAIEYLGNIAPTNKKAMYLGFANFPGGVGWAAESFLGPYLYGKFDSKEQISRATLEAQGMAATEVDKIPVGEAFETLVSMTGQSATELTEQLYAANNVGVVWYVMSVVGLISAVGLYQYGRWIYRITLIEDKAKGRS